MTRTFLQFLAAFLVVGGLDAQDKPAARDAQAEPSATKEKLFEGAALGVKAVRTASGGLFDVLRDKKMQEEIGLIPSQLQELVRLNEEVTKELGPIVNDFNKLPKREQEARAEELRKDLTFYLKGVQADLDKILLPEQQQRLRQVAFQLRMQKSGAVPTLLSPDVLRDLGMNDLEAERLREGLAQIEQQHRDKLNELEVEKERKILALFTPAQQNKLKSLLGPMLPNLSKTPAGPKAVNP